MERIENLTLEMMEVALKEAKFNGYTETNSIENIPIGPTSCSAVIITVNGKKTPCFGLVKFERKDTEGNILKLMYETVKLNVLHISTGKSYNNIYAKFPPELKNVLAKPENLTKEMIFNSVPLVQGQKEGKTTLQFESMSK